MTDSKNPSQHFTSRLGLLLSVLGIAVGTGNIWRFPRIAAQNSGEAGAGAFLIAWLMFLFVWSVPLIIAEYALGRKGGMGVIGTFARVAGSRLAWMGAFVGIVATAIMFYYSVVAGWCIYYFIHSASQSLPADLASAESVWENFQGSGWPVAFHAVALSLGGLAILKGVRSIERVNRILIPTLLAIVVVSLVRAVTLDGATAGISFLFTPDWSTLTQPRTWLEALTQNAWDTGAGWGLILTYGAYMRKEHGVVKNSFVTAVGNNLVSLAAAVTIFGTVFAVLGARMSQTEILQIMQTSGPASTGLTFIWMPQLFREMAGGPVLAVLFFLGLSFAAFSSLISMIELATRSIVDLGLRRPAAVVTVCVSGFVLGLPSAISLDVLGNQDFVWGVALMISGAFVAVAVISHGTRRFAEDAIGQIPGDWEVGVVWRTLITFVVPTLATVLLVWWLYLAATVYAPDDWFNPASPYSVMTCLVQWGAILLGVIALNRWFVRRTLGRQDPGS